MPVANGLDHRANRDAPVRHRARWVGFGGCVVPLHRRPEFERVEQCHRAVELGLRSGVAGRLEVDGAERFSGGMLMLLRLLLRDERRRERQGKQGHANAGANRVHNCLR
jgi:hypothetical protein